MFSKERMRQDAVTKQIPTQRRGEMDSRNKKSAVSAVATISKLFKSDAFAAVV